MLILFIVLASWFSLFCWLLISIYCHIIVFPFFDQLIYDSIKSDKSGTSGFSDCIRFFPPELFSGRYNQILFIWLLTSNFHLSLILIYFSRSGAWTGGAGVWVELSGKMHVLARLLGHLRQKTDDRIVLVSNYTQVHSCW